MHRHYKNAGVFLLFFRIFHIVYTTKKEGEKNKTKNVKNP